MGINVSHLTCCHKFNIHLKKSNSIESYRVSPQCIKHLLQNWPIYWICDGFILREHDECKTRKLKLHGTCCCKSVYDNSEVAVSSFITCFITSKTRFTPILSSRRRRMSTSGPINISILISLQSISKETINSWRRFENEMKKMQPEKEKNELTNDSLDKRDACPIWPSSFPIKCNCSGRQG